MIKYSMLIVLFAAGTTLFAQTSNDSSHLLQLNQQIDQYVVERNVAALDSLYAADFVFSHGSGRIEGKAGWMKTVGRADYPLRQHDSVRVELHGSLALLRGKMNIEKKGKEKTDKYFLRYIRLYARRDHSWQLVSHQTFYEQHLN
jgi:ketosteroid isomerase-like protein